MAQCPYVDSIRELCFFLQQNRLRPRELLLMCYHVQPVGVLVFRLDEERAAFGTKREAALTQE